MDEKTPQDQADQDEVKEFDPEEVENDPAQEPPIEVLKDLMGG